MRQMELLTLYQIARFFSYMYEKGPNLVPNDKGELVMEYTLHKNPEGKMVAKKHRMA